MKKERIQAAKLVQRAIVALDWAISNEAARLGVRAKTVVISIHRDDASTEIAISGCKCAGCAASMARALLNSMHHGAEDAKPDDEFEFGTTADAAGLVN